MQSLVIGRKLTSLLGESREGSFTIYRSDLDPTLVIAIVEPGTPEHDQLRDVFARVGHAFVASGRRTVFVDGSIRDEEWYTPDHLLAIEAHELGHEEAGHGPDDHGRDPEKEEEADALGIAILRRSGKFSAAKLLASEFVERYGIEVEDSEYYE